MFGVTVSKCGMKHEIMGDSSDVESDVMCDAVQHVITLSVMP